MSNFVVGLQLFAVMWLAMALSLCPSLLLTDGFNRDHALTVALIMSTVIACLSTIAFWIGALTEPYGREQL